MKFGAHESIAGGVFNAIYFAQKATCDTVQMFNKSNNQWRAKKLVTEEIDKFFAAQEETGVDVAMELRRTMADRMLGPLLGALQRRYRQTAAEAVDRLFRKELAHLSDQDREAILAWAGLLARRFAHIPSLGLKGLAYEGGVPAVEAFLAGLDEGLAGELRDAARAEGGPRIGSQEDDA